MPTKESIFNYGTNLAGLIAGVGAKLKQDRVSKIKENIDSYYSKGKSLFYNNDNSERDPNDISADLRKGISAYTSLGLTNEAEALKLHYGEQTKKMDTDRSNKYFKNVIELTNPNVKFPQGDVPTGVNDISKAINVEPKGSESFTQFDIVDNGVPKKRLATFNPNANEGKKWTFQDFPLYDSSRNPVTLNKEYKPETTTPPTLKSMSLWNKKTNQAEQVEFNDKTGQYTKGGKAIDINDYRPQTDNEQKGEQIQKKNPPDNIDVYGKYLDKNKDNMATLFKGNEDTAIDRVKRYLYKSGKDADESIDYLKNTYKDDPAVMQFIDDLYNMRENINGRRQKFIEENFK